MPINALRFLFVQLFPSNLKTWASIVITIFVIFLITYVSIPVDFGSSKLANIIF